MDTSKTKIDPTSRENNDECSTSPNPHHRLPLVGTTFSADMSDHGTSYLQIKVWQPHLLLGGMAILFRLAFVAFLLSDAILTYTHLLVWSI